MSTTVESYKKVFLYVYDLSMGLASQLSLSMVGRHFEGIWHTGIVVYNTEYFFGGGIQKLPPGMTPYGTPVKKIELGTTEIDKDTFDQYVQSLSRDRFRPDKYHLFDNNCNSFTDEAAKFLLGTGIPDSIKNLPHEFFETEMGKMLRPMIDSMMGGSSQPMTNPMAMGGGATQTGGDAFGGMGGMGGGGAFGGGAGGFGGAGMPDFNDPAVQNMAQQLMSNPQMLNEAMNNPMVQNMMNQYGMGGMDAQSLMNQMGGFENIQNMMNQMGGMQGMQNMMNQMGGMGGMGGGGGGFPGAFGSGGGMGGFGAPNAFNNPTPSTQTTPASTNMAPTRTSYNDTKTITRYGKSNVPQVVKKLKSTLVEKQISLSDQEDDTLNHLEKFLTSDSKDFNLVSQDTFQLLHKLISEIPEKDVFPVLDLLRLLVQTPSVISRMLTMSQNNVLNLIEDRFVESWSTISMPTQLMVLRTYCNMFPATYSENELIPDSVKFIISSNKFSKLVDIISSSLTSKLEGLRLTAASLASNLSLYMAKDGNDEETQLLCSMAEFCAEESSEETKQRMLLTIYRICKDNANATTLLQQLGHNFDAMVNANSPQDSKLLVADIKRMLA